MRTVLALAALNAASGALLGAVLVLVPHLVGPGATLPAAAYAVASALALGLGTLAAPWADRHGLRPLMAVSTTLLTAAAVLCLVTGSAAAPVLAVATGGAAGLTYVPSLALVAAAPADARPRMLAVLVSGNAVGGFAGPLLVGTTGDQRASGTAALALACAALVHLGARRVVPPGCVSAEDRVDVPVTRNPQLTRLSLATTMAAAGVTGLVALLVPTALAAGAAPEAAAMLPATAAAAALVGRVGQLAWARHVAPDSVLRACGFVTGGCALLLATTAGDLGWMLAATAVVGVAQGAWVAALPAAAVDVAVIGAAPPARRTGLGRVLGRLYAWVAVGTLAGTVLLGLVADLAGSATAFVACGLLCAASATTTPRATAEPVAGTAPLASAARRG